MFYLVFCVAIVSFTLVIYKIILPNIERAKQALREDFIKYFDVEWLRLHDRIKYYENLIEKHRAVRKKKSIKFDSSLLWELEDIEIKLKIEKRVLEETAKKKGINVKEHTAKLSREYT